jgi:hypothetical protein
VAVRDLGPLGPREGPPVSVWCPLSDSLRSLCPGFLLGGLLLLRKANRTRAAWAVLFPLVAVYLVLHIVEGLVNNHSTWNCTAYFCSLACEMLRSFALGLAVLLTVSDLIRVRRRLLRAAAVFLIVVLSGSTSRLLNAPLSVVMQPNPPSTLSALAWSILFGVLVLVFLLALSAITALLRRWTGSQTLKWCARVCLVLGIASVLVLAGVKPLLASTQFLPTRHLIFNLGALTQPLLAPYFVFLWFAVLALLSPFYRQRFAVCLTGGRDDLPQSVPADRLPENGGQAQTTVL